ncbi:hypothetical protein GCM10022631_05230 [Deinococcus rubellus]
MLPRGGSPVKFYVLTGAGRTELRAKREDFGPFTRAVGTVLGGAASPRTSRFVGSFTALGKAGRTQGSDHGTLLLKITSGDLRNVSCQVVSPAQVRWIPAGC